MHALALKFKPVNSAIDAINTIHHVISILQQMINLNNKNIAIATAHDLK